MNITYGIIVVDGMPFIKHQLKLIYPYARQIIICEGGDNTWAKLYGRRRSTDGTIECIKNFPDPQKKIILIQKNWTDKNEMCHEYSKLAAGNVIWHIDVDEFVDPKKIPDLLNLFKVNRNYTTIGIPNYVFWGDTSTIIEAKLNNQWVTNWFSYERIFRRMPGRWIHHIPERGFYSPKSKRVIGGTPVNKAYLLESKIFTYHFSYVLPSNVKDKINYYNTRIPNCINEDWYNSVFAKFKDNKEKWIKDDFNVQSVNPSKHTTFDERLRPLGHKLPDFLKDLEIDLLNLIN